MPMMCTEGGAAVGDAAAELIGTGCWDIGAGALAFCGGGGDMALGGVAGIIIIVTVTVTLFC